MLTDERKNIDSKQAYTHVYTEPEVGKKKFQDNHFHV